MGSSLVTRGGARGAQSPRADRPNTTPLLEVLATTGPVGGARYTRMSKTEMYVISFFIGILTLLPQTAIMIYDDYIVETLIHVKLSANLPMPLVRVYTGTLGVFIQVLVCLMYAVRDWNKPPHPTLLTQPTQSTESVLVDGIRRTKQTTFVTSSNREQLPSSSSLGEGGANKGDIVDSRVNIDDPYDSRRPIILIVATTSVTIHIAMYIGFIVLIMLAINRPRSVIMLDDKSWMSYSYGHPATYYLAYTILVGINNIAGAAFQIVAHQILYVMYYDISMMTENIRTSYDIVSVFTVGVFAAASLIGILRPLLPITFAGLAALVIIVIFVSLYIIVWIATINDINNIVTATSTPRQKYTNDHQERQQDQQLHPYRQTIAHRRHKHRPQQHDNNKTTTDDSTTITEDPLPTTTNPSTLLGDIVFTMPRENTDVATHYSRPRLATTTTVASSSSITNSIDTDHHQMKGITMVSSSLSTDAALKHDDYDDDEGLLLPPPPPPLSPLATNTPSPILPSSVSPPTTPIPPVTTESLKPELGSLATTGWSIKSTDRSSMSCDNTSSPSPPTQPDQRQSSGGGVYGKYKSAVLYSINLFVLGSLVYSSAYYYPTAYTTSLCSADCSNIMLKKLRGVRGYNSTNNNSSTSLLPPRAEPNGPRVALSSIISRPVLTTRHNNNTMITDHVNERLLSRHRSPASIGWIIFFNFTCLSLLGNILSVFCIRLPEEIVYCVYLIRCVAMAYFHDTMNDCANCLVLHVMFNALSYGLLYAPALSIVYRHSRRVTGKRSNLFPSINCLLLSVGNILALYAH